MNASIFISGGESSRDFLDLRADARIRTADPFITSEVLYQLSYVGANRIVAWFARPDAAFRTYP